MDQPQINRPASCFSCWLCCLCLARRSASFVKHFAGLRRPYAHCAAVTRRYGFRSTSIFGYALAPITSTYHPSQTSRENAAIALHEPYPEPLQQLEGAIAGAAESSDLRSSPGRTAAVRRALDASHLTARTNELRQSLASSAARALAAQDQPNMLRRSTYKTL